jgi:hypothetical protein
MLQSSTNTSVAYEEDVISSFGRHFSLELGDLGETGFLPVHGKRITAILLQLTGYTHLLAGLGLL